LVVANNADCMNGTTMMNARYEVVGKCGMCDATLKPLDVMPSMISGKRIDGNTVAGWRSVRTTERRAIDAICDIKRGLKTSGCGAPAVIPWPAR